MHPTSIDLAEDVRGKSMVLLQKSLADAINLALQTKQAHWNVKGPQFIALHELFDSIADIVNDQVDTIAERITAFGGTAEGTLEAVVGRTQMKAYPIDISSGRDHVKALSQALAHFGKTARENVDKADELGDTGTADLFTGISREIDKQLWFVEAHVQADK
ncbi:DNA starvation/stationary phase protection protein Dps [bacterium]|nr:DNA starvation/stationary phase protection protein Dps [bacterium]